jgi:hypothetical protein
MNTSARTFFVFGDWLNDKQRRVQLLPGAVSGSNVYKVVVRTSDIRCGFIWFIVDGCFFYKPLSVCVFVINGVLACG